MRDKYGQLLINPFHNGQQKVDGWVNWLIFTKIYFVFFAWRNVQKEWEKRTSFDVS